MSSTAFRPKRVASTRSYAVGVPPRWTCPSTVTRVSMPVLCSIWMPPHDLDNHDAFVGLGCRVKAVDGFRNDLDGRIKPEGIVRTRKIVIDCFRNADDRISLLLEELMCNA